MTQPVAGRSSAIAASVAANLFLGASSLYWRALAGIPPVTLVAYRVLLSLVTLAAVLALLRRLRTLVTNANRRNVLVHSAAGVLVAVNWGTFIWASIHGSVLESGLGYLVAPFVTVGFGAIMFSERIGRARLAALVGIAIAIAFLAVGSGELEHWVYVTIGLSWGLYGALKKLSGLDSFGGLFYETAVLTIVLCALLAVPGTVSLALPGDLSPVVLLLLLTAGIVSVLPLWLFSLSVAGLPLALMGFFQFVLPTTQVVVALVAYGQPMSTRSVVIYAVIWAILLLTAVETFMTARFAREKTGDRT